MSNRVKSVIKLRADTISNWLANQSTTLQDKELSIIRYNDGTVGFKLGTGDTYANTNLLKFNSLITNNISDGINTFTFPSTGGVLAKDNSNEVASIEKPGSSIYSLRVSTTKLLYILSKETNKIEFYDETDTLLYSTSNSTLSDSLISNISDTSTIAKIIVGMNVNITADLSSLTGLTEVKFLGREWEDIEGMSNYPFNISDEIMISEFD